MLLVQNSPPYRLPTAAVAAALTCIHTPLAKIRSHAYQVRCRRYVPLYVLLLVLYDSSFVHACKLNFTHAAGSKITAAVHTGCIEGLLLLLLLFLAYIHAAFEDSLTLFVGDMSRA